MDLQGEKSSGRQRRGTNRSANAQIPLATVSYPVNAHCPVSTCRSHTDLLEKKILQHGPSFQPSDSGVRKHGWSHLAELQFNRE